jgi:hypothetical protein
MNRAGISNEQYLEKAADVFSLVIRRTKQDPIKAETIQGLTGVDTRIVADMLRQFEIRGIGICSGPFGYYLARDRREWEGHINKERDRGIKIIKKTVQAKKSYVVGPTLFDQPEQARKVG